MLRSNATRWLRFGLAAAAIAATPSCAANAEPTSSVAITGADSWADADGGPLGTADGAQADGNATADTLGDAATTDLAGTDAAALDTPAAEVDAVADAADAADVVDAADTADTTVAADAMDVADATDLPDIADPGATDTSSADAASPDASADVSQDSTKPEEDAPDAVADSGVAVSLPPTQGAELLKWLTAGSYANWPAESAPHASTGPHFGDVRTFVTPTLHASLAAGAAVHPVDASVVKELYGKGKTVLGWAVMRKVAAKSGGDSWYWYETYQGTQYASGTGVGLCTGCHSPGKDYVLTPFPLK